MKLDDLKKLLPVGILLVAYAIVPVFVRMFMGDNDIIFGTISFSLIVRACLGVALGFGFFRLMQPLAEALGAWLAKYAQPQAKTRELAEKLARATVFALIVLFLFSLVTEFVTFAPLLTVIKVCVLAYAAYLAFTIWKLAEPFISHVPPGTTPPKPPADSSEHH